jgi:choline kinase
MVNHAILLAAGQGTRLLPITATLPKCLVEVGGRTILQHQLAALAEAGVERATVMTGYRHVQVEQALAGSQPLAVATRFNPFWAVASSIGSVWGARDLMAEPFCILNGDTLFDATILRQALRAPVRSIGLVVEPIAAADYDDMLVSLDGGQVSTVSKDLPEEEATHRSLGLVVVNGFAEYRATLEEIIGERNGVGAYHHAIVDRLARRWLVSAIERAPGLWQEIDRPEDIVAWRMRHEAAITGQDDE